MIPGTIFINTRKIAITSNPKAKLISCERLVPIAKIAFGRYTCEIIPALLEIDLAEITIVEEILRKTTRPTTKKPPYPSPPLRRITTTRK
jgi:hypothetical protein